TRKIAPRITIANGTAGPKNVGMDANKDPRTAVPMNKAESIESSAIPVEPSRTAAAFDRRSTTGGRGTSRQPGGPRNAMGDTGFIPANIDGPRPVGYGSDVPRHTTAIDTHGLWWLD